MVERVQNETPQSDVSVCSTTAEPVLSAVSISLSAPVFQGFIEPARNGYQFCHDKLQVAFCSLSDNEQQELIHHDNAGKVYLVEVKALHHLNCVKNLTLSGEEDLVHANGGFVLGFTKQLLKG